MTVKFDVKKNSPGLNVKKISNKQAYFFCFNMIVGYAFILGISSVFQEVGNYFIILIVICSLLALIVGLAYAKLSRHYDSNGGAFLYTYKAFGRNTAYFFGWFQYIKTPVVGLSAILGMVWAFDGIKGIGSDGTYPWYLYIIAISLFILIFIFLYFGYTGGKFALIVLSVLKWSLLIFVLILALIFIPAYGKNIFLNGYNPKSWTDSWHLFLSFIPATLTFFFAYGGFEDFASMNSDFEDPKKTVPRVLVFVFIASTIFYIIIFYLFLGSLGAAKNPFGLDPNYAGKDVNPINSVTFQTFGAAVGFIFAVIIIVSQLSNKACGRLQTSWTVARQLSPLAESGFLPRVLAKRNRYGQLQNSILFDSVFVSIIIASYLLAAIFIFHTQNSGRLSGALSIYSFVAFVVYAGTIASLLKISRHNKEINLNVWEKIMYCFGLMVLLFLLLFYVIAGATTANGLSLILQLITIGFFLFCGLIIYVIGHFNNWHKHQLSHNYFLDHIEDPVTVSSI